MTPVTLRHSIIAQSKLGWSGILAISIKRLLFGPHGISTVGLPLRVNGALFIIKGRLSIMISDGGRIRSAFNWKGASSTKPCLLHHNVFSRDSDLVHRAEGNVEITCHDPNLFQHWVDDGLEKVVDLISLAHQRVERRGVDQKTLRRIATSLRHELRLWRLAERCCIEVEDHIP